MEDKVSYTRMLSSEINGALTSSTGWRLKLLKESWNLDDGHIAWGYAEWKINIFKVIMNKFQLKMS